MGLDIRLPIGAMFVSIGALLIVFGLLTSGHADLYKLSLGVNINLWWGLVMLVFGLVMTWFGLRGTSAEPAPGATPAPGETDRRPGH